MRAGDVLGPRGPLANGIAGYEHRESQLAMADAVEETMLRDGVLMVEAGTGTGKTLAYLVPALLSGRKVVVSTGTKTLQDQIMDGDLPMLERHLGQPIHAACMKGLANYLCLRRFAEFGRSAEARMGASLRQLPIVERWRELTASGDRADLLELPEDAGIWSQINSSTDTRIGQKCNYFEDCFVTKMRKRADAAQLVVVNHHLYFADVAMRVGGGLGSVIPDHDVVIFDEAHQIEDIATLFFGVTVSPGKVDRLARDVSRALGGAQDLDGSMRLPSRLTRASEEFFGAFPRITEGTRQVLMREAFNGLVETKMFALDDALELAQARCRNKSRDSEACAQVARRAGRIRDELAQIAQGRSARRITYLQRKNDKTTIGASPVDVSELLREELFFEKRAVILTSATLSTGGSLEFMKRRLGLDFDPKELLLSSPFDYGAQAALYIPEQLPDPRDAAYFDCAVEEILSLVSIVRGGAFVLCTSFRAMRELARLSRAHLEEEQNTRVFVQGEAPKSVLLDAFRRAGDAVLFATMSFWEGVDVPGDALRLVIIDKLPFDVPSDPLIAARCEQMKERGENPFMELLVPSAALTLKQGFGRLIRSRRDRGVVAILDRRLVKKGYGRVFLESLPPASRCYSMGEVEAFWESTQASPSPSAE